MNLFSPFRRAVILITVQLNVSIAKNGRDLDKDEVPQEDRTGNLMVLPSLSFCGRFRSPRLRCIATDHHRVFLRFSASPPQSPIASPPPGYNKQVHLIP